MRNKQDLYVEEFSVAVIVDKDLIILQICAWGFIFSSHFPYKAKKQKKKEGKRWAIVSNKKVIF